MADTFACVQVTGVTAETLATVLADLVTRVKTVGEARCMQLAAGMDLSLTQLSALFILETSEHALAVHELAERLDLSVAATGRAVDHLARDGLVRRREDAHDRRVKRLTLAEPGAALLSRLTRAHRDGLHAFAGLLTGAERDKLHDALAPILARLRTPTSNT